jgi:hypothetical protein
VYRPDNRDRRGHLEFHKAGAPKLERSTPRGGRSVHRRDPGGKRRSQRIRSLVYSTPSVRSDKRRGRVHRSRRRCSRTLLVSSPECKCSSVRTSYSTPHTAADHSRGIVPDRRMRDGTRSQVCGQNSRCTLRPADKAIHRAHRTRSRSCRRGRTGCPPDHSHRSSVPRRCNSGWASSVDRISRHQSTRRSPCRTPFHRRSRRQTCTHRRRWQRHSPSRRLRLRSTRLRREVARQELP